MPLPAAPPSLSFASSPTRTQPMFGAPPHDAAGREFDLSSLPLLCSSVFSNPVLDRTEIVFGGADHALYCIPHIAASSSSSSSAVVKMYTAQFGHTDWVTAVTHLSDGRVVSSGMDGKLCLWEHNKRRCADLRHHTKSISKVLAAGNNLCLSSSYDGTIAVWDCQGPGSSSTASASASVVEEEEAPATTDRFGRPMVVVTRTGGSGASSRRQHPVRAREEKASAKPRVPTTPSAVLTGHKSPVLELAYGDRLVCSGGKDGALVSWDLGCGEQVQRVRAHEASITALKVLDAPGASSALCLSGAADGTVKLWDPRSKTLCASGVPHPGSPVTALAASSSSSSQQPDGPGASDSLVITAGADGVVALFDRRQGVLKTPLCRLEHARHGVYSMALVGPCLFVGDGGGTLLCYDVRGQVMRYGLGSSRVGAVRCIEVFTDRRVIAVGNEDGKCLLYDF